MVQVTQLTELVASLLISSELHQRKHSVRYHTQFFSLRVRLGPGAGSYLKDCLPSALYPRNFIRGNTLRACTSSLKHAQSGMHTDPDGKRQAAVSALHAHRFASTTLPSCVAAHAGSAMQQPKQRVLRVLSGRNAVTVAGNVHHSGFKFGRLGNVGAAQTCPSTVTHLLTMQLQIMQPWGNSRSAA